MHDLLIQNGRFHDGFGSPEREADLAVSGGVVVAVGHDLGPAARSIDATGRIISPGFIDPHTHSDFVHLLDGPQPFKLLQGITSEVVGNCGYSAAPLSEEAAEGARASFGELTAGVDMIENTFAGHLDRVAAAVPTNNVAFMVGHATLRITANGYERELRDGALAEMCALADEAFADGAVGLSTGLVYTPGAYADTEELVALATVAYRWHRTYATHLRDEGPRLEAALDEAFEVSRRSKARLQLSHCKAAGRPNHGKSRLLLDKVHSARLEGIDVRGDQYPYMAGKTFLRVMLPPSASEGGVDALRRRLAAADERDRLERIAMSTDGVLAPGMWAQVRPEDILITRHAGGKATGRSLADVAGEGDAWTTLCALIEQDPNSMMVVWTMGEEDVIRLMGDPLISVGSDSGVPQGLDHPRTWGTFPHFLGAYVRDKAVMDWPEAIRKMTSSSAAQFSLRNRGWLGPGAVADICVFDPETISHPATYIEPHLPPVGVEHVLLAGTVVVDGGDFTGARRGEVLRA